MDYEAYRDKHRGAVAWVIGAGPSLDAFLVERPFIDERDLIVGINETPIVLARHGIHCDYTVAADPLDRYAHALPPQVPLFVPDFALTNSRAPLPINPTIIVPPGNTRGSVIVAARVLAHMGVNRMKLVGVDGGKERGDQEWFSPPSLCDRAYDTIRGILLEWATLNGASISFWSSGNRIYKYPTRFPLEPYVGRHPGSIGWIIGKGSSLDAFLDDASPLTTVPTFASAPVIAFLSDTVKYIPRIIDAVANHYPTGMGVAHAYAFASDEISRWVDTYPSGITLFQPRRTVNDPSMAAPAPPCPRVVYEDSGAGGTTMDLPPIERIHHPLFNGHGTCDAAAQILALMGCESFVAIGCDGRPGRSSLPWRTHIRFDVNPDKDYAEIRHDFERILLMLDITTEFYGEDRIIKRTTIEHTAA